VKKLYREASGQIRLQPANPEMLPLIIRGDQVRVRGIVVGVLRKYGFNRKPPRARGSRPAPQPRPVPAEEPTLDLAVNALDAQLARWHTTLEKARRHARLRKQLPAMEELGRDLQALRDWCARTNKPSLRRALIAEANRLMGKMERWRVDVG